MYDRPWLMRVLIAYWLGDVTQREWLRALFIVGHSDSVVRQWEGRRYE